MAANNTPSSSSASSASTAPSLAIKSSFTFPARPAQQQQEQQQQHFHRKQVTAYTGTSSSSASTTACTSYNPHQQQPSYAPSISHTPQPSLSAASRKSSASSGSDPFAYDRASLRATLASTTSTSSRHTPHSSLASLNGVIQAASTTSPALSSAGASDRNKDLPPQPASSPARNGLSSLPSTSSSTVTAIPSSEAQSAVFVPAPAEYVQALHDYAAVPGDGSANICLSFRAGDFIKVLNRDSSGWWDGEINGTRGWFPSNYVGSEAYDLASLPGYANSSQDPRNANAVASTSSEPMRRAATTPATIMSQSSIGSYESRPDTPAFDSSRRPSSQDTVTSAIEHAIHLMQVSVDANRISHFRPASSCFVVAVKSILHATDTLAKDSVILRTHLILARQRKQILSNLANVMTMARNASSPEMDIMSRARETGLMLQTAHVALNNVENFLQTAMQCGVDVPARIETEMDERSTQQLSSLQAVSTPNLDACLQFTLGGSENSEVPLLSANSSRAGSSSHRTTSSASSSGGKSLHKARSLSDMKNAPRRKMSEASNASSGTSSSQGPAAAMQQPYSFLGKPPSPNGVPRRPAPNVRRPSIPAAYATINPGSTWQANDSISSATSSLNSSHGPSTPTDTSVPQQPTEVYRTLTLIHDQLLSTIAAFIGHVHAHSRTSHSSSYAHLIDMTRESIERVRETLIIVDVIIAHPALSGFTRDLKYLGKYREALYLATTTLVTSARNATSPLSPDLTDEALIHEQEEEEKHELLKAATGVLRASADCVNSTKPLLLRRRGSDAAFVIDLLQSASSELSRSTSNSTEPPIDEDATVQATDSGIGSEDNTYVGGNRDGEKGRHTVSMLARKATSLTCMRDNSQSGDESHLADLSAESIEEIQGQEYEDADESNQRSFEAEFEAAWSGHQQAQRSSQQRRGSTSSSASTRNSYHFPRSDSPGQSELSASSLSTRRGMPIPPNLTIQTRYPGVSTRPPSLDAMSATSTITSIPRDKAPTPSQSGRAASATLPSSEPKSASSTSTTGSDSYKAGGEAMSRDESSRGSAASTATSSYRSITSDTNTADTSPRSSLACASPAEERVDWQYGETAKSALSKRPVVRAEAYRARSGSTPDRITALRISEGASGPFSPLSPRSPHVFSQPSQVDASALASNKACLLERDYEPKECCFNADGNVTGGTLRCLVERMTLHDQTIDANFSNSFFLTFRMFTTPIELTKLLFARYNINPPASAALSEVEHKIWREQKLTPVRLRIYNFFKTWLESHWRPTTDAVILDMLMAFTRDTMMSAMPAAAQRLVDLLQKRSVVVDQTAVSGRARALTRMASTDKLKAGKPISDGIPLGSATFPGPGSSLPPSPIVSKSLLNSLRTPPFAPNTILDFDPLELARQFTIMESRLYCAILPEDLIGQDFGKSGSNRSTNIRAMSSLSTRITGWIAEIILSEQDAKKRSALVKYFIKLADRCMLLQNYNTLMAILAALNSSTISRLKKTWEGLSNKHKVNLETLRRNTEHTRNYAQYRATIRGAVAPCLPFLGLTLTDLTFCQDGNSAERASPLDTSLRLINFDRYQKIAKIINDVQRFQVPYNLSEVPEIQSFLQNALRNIEHGGDPQALYRRSLMVEPREQTSEHQGVPPSAGLKDTFGWRI